MKSHFEKKAHNFLLLFFFIQLVVSIPIQAEFLVEGAKLIPLTDDGKSIAVSWAYKGDLICFVRQETSTQRQLLIMDSEGENEQAVTPMGNPFFAEWSWSGKKLSYEFSNARDNQSQGGVFIYNVESNRSIPFSAPYPGNSIYLWDGPFWSADNKWVAYTLHPETTRKYQVFVADTETGKYERLLAERGQGREQRWGPLIPPKMCLLTEAGGGGYDLTVVCPDGKELVLLTDISGQSVDIDCPRWSPNGEWIAYTSDIDMTQTERGLRRTDCWISRPDDSESRNLTNATSSATEKQLSLGELLWSWDGRWILGEGERYDNQGNEISTIYLIDPVKGGYEPIITCDPRKTGEYEAFSSIKWSYDSTKILIFLRHFTVKNWGPDSEFENPQSILRIYDIEKRDFEDILIYDEHLERKRIVGTISRARLEDIFWSPDNRSILLTIATIISIDDNISKPDVYRLDLPGRLISPIAALHIGPPIGREAAVATSVEFVEQPTTQQPVQNMSQRPQTDENGLITETLKPMHMTVDEAIESLSSEYSLYFTTNIARNLLLFKGPPEVLSSLKEDLKLVDTPAPHILVDLLAVELSDEATQELGLDWTYTEDSFGFYQPSGRPIGTGEALDNLYTLPGLGQSFYQGVGKLPNEFFIRLNSLITEGEGTILANPRTVSMSGKESLINIRKTLNYFYDEGFDVAGRPIVRKSDISADTEGRIVPTLLADGTINLVVDVKVGNYTFTPEAGLPELTTRQSTTEVTVQEEQTLILGGLREQQVTTAVRKVPILGDLPLFGNLFRQEETSTNNSVLTIFITPHILDNGESLEWPKLDPNDHQIVPIMRE